MNAEQVRKWTYSLVAYFNKRSQAIYEEIVIRFSGQVKKFRLFSYWSSPAVKHMCSIIFSVVIKMTFSRRKNTTQLHLMPWLGMSADVRQNELI